MTHRKPHSHETHIRHTLNAYDPLKTRPQVVNIATVLVDLGALLNVDRAERNGIKQLGCFTHRKRKG